jgi:hypothetical protein
LPASAVRISSSVGCARQEVTDASTMPGVQMPHSAAAPNEGLLHRATARLWPRLRSS